MKKNDKTDEAIGAMLKNTLPKASADPWFTRRVLARLPELRRRIASRIEIWVCAVAALATLVLGIRFVAETVGEPAITYGDVFVYAVYLTVFACLTYNALSPLTRVRV